MIYKLVLTRNDKVLRIFRTVHYTQNMKFICAIAVLFIVSTFAEGRRYYNRRRFRPKLKPVVEHIKGVLKHGIGHDVKHAHGIKHDHGHVPIIKPPMKPTRVKSIKKEMLKPKILKPKIPIIKPDLVKPIGKELPEIIKPTITDCPPLDVCQVQLIPEACREQTFIRFNGRLCPGCDRDICTRRGRSIRNPGRRFNPVDQFLDSLTGRGPVEVPPLAGAGVPVSQRGFITPGQRGFIPRAPGVSEGRPLLIESGSGGIVQAPQIPIGAVPVVPSTGNVQVVPSGVNAPILRPGARFPQIPAVGGPLDTLPQDGPIEFALPPQLQNQPGQTLGPIPGRVGQLENNGVRFLGVTRGQGANANPFQTIGGEPFSGRLQNGFTTGNSGLFQDVSSFREVGRNAVTVSAGGANSWATG